MVRFETFYIKSFSTAIVAVMSFSSLVPSLSFFLFTELISVYFKCFYRSFLR